MSNCFIICSATKDSPFLLLLGSAFVFSVAVVRMKRSLALDDEVETPFIANHPCLWMLRHNPSGLWLFVGRLSQPAASDTFEFPVRDEL